MERRGFLKSLGILAVTACIPEPLEKAVEVIEKKSVIPPEAKAMLDFKNQRYVNHITIQRKTVAITGSAQTNVIWCEYKGNMIGFVPHPLFEPEYFKK